MRRLSWLYSLLPMHAQAHTPITPELEFGAVSRSFGGQVVLQDVTLHWRGPGIVGLAGPNGSGKTSLLRLAAQVLEPDEGVVRVCGVETAGGSARARRLCGFAPHEALAWGTRTVQQNLVQAARLLGETRSSAPELARAASARWGLEPVASLPVASLSRGWAQRYSLARADLLEPPLLLLDEPTTGLDAHGREHLDDALEGWGPTRLVVVSSHERDWLASRARELLDLSAQPVVSQHTPAGAARAAGGAA